MAGDLCASQLGEVREEEKNLHGMIHPTLELAGDRPTIIFTATVRQAELVAEIINRHKPESAAWVSCKTPQTQRKELLKQFAAGNMLWKGAARVVVT